ncbi:MAG TPA: hypothetical protein PKA53_02290 [Sphingobacterium sp.]|nr:hypothetical protein [Sphingobacterium sp.]
MIKKDIPPQYTGKTVDYHKSVDFSSTYEADRFFNEVKLKLVHVNDWHHITEGPSAEFCIVDAGGNLLERTVEKGDRIRIDIPGPGLPSAKGYDWVQVEDIDEEDTAHFFKSLATSTILVEQTGSNVSLQYAGRNEVINTENESNWDNIRNFLVGIGAKMGASYPQWKALIDGLAHTGR